VGFIQSIIDFIMGLFGMKKDPPQLSSGERQQIQNQSVKGLDEVEGAENVKVHGTAEGSNIIEHRDGADLIEDPDDEERLWSANFDGDVSPEAWVDVWGPLSGPDALVEHLTHSAWFDEMHEGDPLGAEKKIQELGYKDAGEYFKVKHTILKHHGTPHGSTLGEYVYDSQAFMSATMAAQRAKLDAAGADMMAANPELSAPIDGVTLETYAEMSAAQAQGMSQEEFLAQLGKHGLDLATWEKASGGWMDRMSKDTTGFIATIYAKAFQGAGQGQFGAAAQAHAGTGYDGTAAAGAEPIPFEKACEIQGAMTAWSNTGKDVNAMLQSTFGMNAAEWAGANSWWMSQLMADVARFDDYNKKCAEYEKKYGGGGGDADSDLSF